MLRIPAVLLCAVCLSAPAAAEIYTWVDEQGNTHYSDKPEDANASVMAIQSKRTDPERIRAEAEQRLDRESERLRQLEKQADEDASQADDDARMAAQRTENCRIAKQQLEVRVNSRRLYRQLEGGEREWLSDAEIEQSRVDAQAEVDKWCN